MRCQVYSVCNLSKLELKFSRAYHLKYSRLPLLEHTSRFRVYIVTVPAPSPRQTLDEGKSFRRSTVVDLFPRYASQESNYVKRGIEVSLYRNRHVNTYYSKAFTRGIDEGSLDIRLTETGRDRRKEKRNTRRKSSRGMG